MFLDIFQPMLSTTKATREAWWWVCLKVDTELYQHADFFLFHEKSKSWTKALSKIKPNHWLECYQMIISDRSIIFFTSSFPFLIYPPENVVIKVKWFMLVRDEKIGIESGNIMKNGKSYLLQKPVLWKSISNMYFHECEHVQSFI